MAFGVSRYLERRGFGRVMRKLGSVTSEAGRMSAGELRAAHRQAASLRDRAATAGIAAEAALVRRRGAQDGIDRPDQCDWAFRPAPWSEPLKLRGLVGVETGFELGGGVKLFHDSGISEVALRQVANRRDDIPAAYGLVLEVYRFDGSFLSLVQNLPDAALDGLTQNHVLRLKLRMAIDNRLEVYARLNIQHGPNVEQIVRQIAFDGDTGLAEFDLAYSKFNEKRLEKIWLDLIFERPQMNRMALWDMTMTRAPRADL